MMIMMIDGWIDREREREKERERQADVTASPELCTRYQKFSDGLSMLPSASETDKQAIN